MNGLALSKTIYLPAEPARVWAFLTEPDRLATWFQRPDRPLTEGADFAILLPEDGGVLFRGHVTRARPSENLEYSLEINNIPSRVAWRIEPAGGGVRLLLSVDGLPGGAEAFGFVLALDEGWDAHLSALRINIPDVDAENPD